MQYSRQDIICKCQKAIKDVKTFYKCDFINYRGKTSDTYELYNEVVADFVIQHFSEFENIPVITRESSYKTKGHDGDYNAKSNRIEEITAMELFKQSRSGRVFDGIGKIIDYQTPLKNKKTDEAGKIDLLSVNKNTVYVLELKKEDSSETMLRCVLECYTYLKTLCGEKLLKDFNLSSDSVIKASPLVFWHGKQWEEMQEHRPYLKKLIETLDCKPFYIFKRNDYYILEV